MAPAVRGPKGPSKLTDEVVAKVRELRAGGAKIASVAAEVGISVDSVRTTLAGAPAPAPEPAGPTSTGGGGLVPWPAPSSGTRNAPSPAPGCSEVRPR